MCRPGRPSETSERDRTRLANLTAAPELAVHEPYVMQNKRASINPSRAISAARAGHQGEAERRRRTAERRDSRVRLPAPPSPYPAFRADADVAVVAAAAD